MIVQIEYTLPDIDAVVLLIEEAWAPQLACEALQRLLQVLLDESGRSFAGTPERRERSVRFVSCFILAEILRLSA